MDELQYLIALRIRKTTELNERFALALQEYDRK